MSHPTTNGRNHHDTPTSSPGLDARHPGTRRRSSIVIDASGRIMAPERRKSSLKKFPSIKHQGKDNVAFVREPGGDGTQMQEVHLGHSAELRRKSAHYIKKELEIDYHEIDLEDLFQRYGTHPNNGLSTGQIDKNRERYGKNELTPPKVEPLWLTFLKTLVGGFQLLLWAGGILSFAAYIVQFLQTDSTPPPDNLYLGIVLVVLVVVLGLFTFYQEYSSGKVMESFAKMVPSYATTIRDGKTMSLNATELVVGDVVEVKFGDRIPADIRIIECSGLKVDNSSLTGESEPQSRSTQTTDENPMETKNLAFFSTNALEGTAKGIVVAVGDGTFIGRIAGLASGMDSIDTPMSREISHFVKIISGVAVFFGVAFFVVALTMRYKVIDAAIFLIGIIVANVPEGLLVTFTVILALTAKRMAAKNCLVRQLHAVETLGSCSVICSDKTGTLTQNLMTASHVWFGGKVLEASVDAGDFNKDDPGFSSLQRVATLCSRAKFLAGQENLPPQERQISGDASESAILRCMDTHLSGRGGVEGYQTARKKIFEIPFNSSNKWQLSIHELHDEGGHKGMRYLMVMKGAPERIIDLCTKIRLGASVVELDEGWKKTFNQVYEEIGGMGERVIGFCEYLLPIDKYVPGSCTFDAEDISFTKEGLTFVGLISMIDPPRPGVPSAVQMCREAGIKVVMVTGDHPITAKAIAQKVGIISEGSETPQEKARKLNIDLDDVDFSSCPAIVINGAELLEMSTEELDDVLKDHAEIVFARVSPQQKLVIVEGFQRLGKIVAVTGDGVNDSPALKKADIGIAMGISGSDVSKQAADMILLDDNFSSIVVGVEEGRLIFENLKKCICYLLAANIAELLPFLCYITFKIPLPLGTIPMLIICLGTDILPTISLSYEKSEGDIMKRAPRNPMKDKLVTDKLISYSYGQLGVIEFFAGMLAYFVIMGESGFRMERLIGLQSRWDSNAVNDLEDSYGQEWTYARRKALEKTCWTGYFCAVVVCQWGNVLVSKVRRAPLVSKLFDNWLVFGAIIAETLLACFLTYTPGLNVSISYMPIRFVWWLPGLPFLVFLVVHDELRRFILRRMDSWKWYQQEFYY